MTGIVDVVRKDLQWLSKHLEFGTTDLDEIRRHSPIVRRLVVEDTLVRARREAGAVDRAMLAYYPLGQAIDLGSLGDGDLAAALGCRVPQTPGSTQTRLAGPFYFGPTGGWQMPRPPEVEILRVESFANSACIIVDGETISRNQIVKYVANKQGGVHFDTNREKKRDDYIKLIDKVDGYFLMEPMPLVSMTLLAIAQALISSKSVMEPFGLAPIDMSLGVPLGQRVEEVTVPARSWLRYDVTGNAD